MVPRVSPLRKTLCVLTLLVLPAVPLQAAPAASVAESMSRVEIALDERDLRQAAEWLQPLLDRNDQPPARRAELRWLLARLLRLQGENALAMDAAATAVAAARESGDGSLLVSLLQDRALLALLVGDRTASVADLKELEKMGVDAGDLQVSFDAGSMALRLLGPDRGIPLLAAYILNTHEREQGKINSYSALLAIADLLLFKGDANRAIESYDLALGANPDSAEAYLGRVRAHLLLKQRTDARADLEAGRALLSKRSSSLSRDLGIEVLDELAGELGTGAGADDGAGDGLAALRAAMEAENWDDARKAAEAAIERDHNAPAPRAALAEIYLRQGEYAGAANVFAALSLLKDASTFPRAGGTLAKALMGSEVYDVEGFAIAWFQLTSTQKVALREVVAAARQRGPLPATVKPLIKFIEGGMNDSP